MSLTDTATFEKDEWGPWAEQMVRHNNPETGEIQLVKVLRTIPAGVLLMKSYPDIRINPGVTDWKEDSEWERERVFADLRRWQYHGLNASDAAAAKSSWVSLHRWHKSHPTADTVTIGEAVVVGDHELRSPLLPWSDMWKALKTYTVPTTTTMVRIGAAGAAGAQAEGPAAASARGGKRRIDRCAHRTCVVACRATRPSRTRAQRPSRPHAPHTACVRRARLANARHTPHPARAVPVSAAHMRTVTAAHCRMHVHRQVLGASTSAAESNVVTHPGYSDVDRRIASIGEGGAQYLADNIDERRALFLIRLEHFEGELPVGLGRRSFDKDIDQDGIQYAIEWFERKNKRTDGWGVRPSFRLVIAGYERNRRPIYSTTTEKMSDFLPITVKNTGSGAEPTLSSDCLSALRTYLKLQKDKDPEQPQDSSEEEAPVKRKGKFRRVLESESDND